MSEIISWIKDGEQTLRSHFEYLDEIALQNQRKVLSAFRKYQVSDYHLHSATGYGYGNAGRETLDQVYAEIFHTESALVRGQFLSGTHAIGTALFACLRPGDVLLSATGLPYDTMRQVIGIAGEAIGNLTEFGVTYQQIDLTVEGRIDLDALDQALQHPIKVILIQRSRGYEWRSALTISQIKEAIERIRMHQPQAIVVVDNCYGEFTDIVEPTDVGADLVAGSLIKNPGGGIAPGGGYIVGKAACVEAAAARFAMPGIGLEMGSSFGDSQRLMFQGLFLAPHTVIQSIKGMHLLAFVMNKLGYTVSPHWSETRNDIIQAIRFPESTALIEFCRAVQRVSPVDSHLLLEPWDMPGYQHQVIMAAGAFIQGSSIELSADAPMREPYTVYVQGGLTLEHVKLAIEEIGETLLSHL